MAVLMSFVLGLIGNATAILALVAPMPTFWRIFKTKTTGAFSVLPYLFSLLGSLFWLYYGLLKQGGMLVVTINGTACAFQVFYISLYLWFCSRVQRKTASLLLLTVISSYATTVVLTMTLAHRNKSILPVGVLGAVISVVVYASPLSVMRMVIKTRSVQFMPFNLSFFFFLNGVAWLSYALSLKDMFIAIPNAIGVMLGAIQLVLYTFYKFRGEAKILDENLKPTLKHLQSLKEIETVVIDCSGSKLPTSLPLASLERV